MASLAALGLVFLKIQVVWASAAMATPKKGGGSLGERFLGYKLARREGAGGDAESGSKHGQAE